jgi:YfiH family protein
VSFYKDARGAWRARNLDALDWLEHGFGTRSMEGWPPGPVATVKQIHSAICVTVAGSGGVLGRADALVTRTPGTWLTIRTADCVPILLADVRRRVVAAAHAGWKGTAANIAAAVLGEMDSDPADVYTAIGPAVCGRCYEVSADVAAQFQRWFTERSDLDRKTLVDLPETNRRQLVEAGVAESRIAFGAPCTLTEASDFYSYRREPGERGRMVSAIRIL